MKRFAHFQSLACGTALLAASWASGVHAAPADDVRQAQVSLRTGDVSTAMSLLRKAADQDNPLAQARLADLLHSAEFDAEALALYRRSAAQGEAAGEFGLGRMYADGAGVPRDPGAALEWYRKAEGKDYWPALDALARAYRSGALGLAKDAAHAAGLEARVRTLQAADKEAAR